MSVATRVAAQQQAGTIEIYRDANSEWRWQAVAKDGEVTQHPEGYIRKALAKQTARKLHPGWRLNSTRQPTEAKGGPALVGEKGPEIIAKKPAKKAAKKKS